LQLQLQAAFSRDPELARLIFDSNRPHITIARQPGKFGSQIPFTFDEEQIIKDTNANFSSITIPDPSLGDIGVFMAFNAPLIATISNSLAPTVSSAVSLSYPSVPAAQPSISLFSPVSTTVVPLETVF